MEVEGGKPGPPEKGRRKTPVIPTQKGNAMHQVEKEIEYFCRSQEGGQEESTYIDHSDNMANGNTPREDGEGRELGVKKNIQTSVG